MKLSSIILLCVMLMACNTSETSTAPVNAETFSADGYIIQPIDGSATQLAIRKDENGTVKEKGYLIDGQKNGVWTTFYDNEMRPKTIINYVNGKKHGLALEMNERNTVSVEAYYINDVLEGPWRKWRSGTVREKETFYKNGQLNNYYREYHRNGKLMKEIKYKDGVMHGSFKQYDDQEKLLMQYTYENGQKVSGGIVQ